MSRAAPPGEERAGGTLEAYRPRKTKNAAAPIDDSAFFRNHRIVEVKRCLSEHWWLWLIWHAAANDGGEP
jgi:hypothetical protein